MVCMPRKAQEFIIMAYPGLDHSAGNTVRRCLLLMDERKHQAFQTSLKEFAGHHTSSSALPLWLQGKQAVGAEALFHCASQVFLYPPLLWS